MMNGLQHLRISCEGQVPSHRHAQIRKLTVHLTSFGHEPGQPTDHLKLFQVYLGSFPSLQILVFHWEECRQKCVLPLRLELVNATMDASQTASFMEEHHSSLREFNFQNVVLRSRNWDDALAPLTQLTHTMDVPIVLSPAGVSQKQLKKATCDLQQQKDRGR